MNRSIQALLASMLLVGGTAQAQTAPGTGQETGTTGSKSTTSGAKSQRGTQGQTGATGQTAQAEPGAPAIEPKKHLTEIDIYLRDALSNTKVLYQMSQWPTGKLDRVIERETLQNLDKSIGGALMHISHVQTLPDARVSDTQDLTQLHNDLTQSRNIVSQLRRTASGNGPLDRAQLQTLSSQLYSSLETAESTYGKLADATDTMRVDRINVPERQPVRGGQPGTTMPSPGSSVPGSMDQQGGGLQQPGGTGTTGNER